MLSVNSEYRRPFGVANLPPARMAMVVGTAPESPPGASAKARGCSAPRLGTLYFATSDMNHRSSQKTQPSLIANPPSSLSGADGAVAIVVAATLGIVVPVIAAAIHPVHISVSLDVRVPV